MFGKAGAQRSSAWSKPGAWRRHRRAIPGNGDYRRIGKGVTGRAAATNGRAKHWQREVVFCVGSAQLGDGIVLTSNAGASKRQAEQGHRTDQLGYGTGMWCSARAWGRRALLRQKHSIESQGHGIETRWHSHDMQGRSKALGTNAQANRSRPTRRQGEASRGVAGQGIGEARRDTALAEQVVARPSLASNESIQH